MKSPDRTILIGLGLLGLIAAFWFVILSPKREEAAQLEGDVAELQSAVDQQEQLAAAGEAAEGSFDENYRSLVVLGKAVPSDSDTSSLFVQLDELAGGAGVRLDSIELTAGSGSAPPPPAAETTTDPPAGAPAEAAADAAVPTAPVAATETAAASLPIGATVGPAGLPVMPYELGLSGSFFQLSDFLKSVDDLVGLAGGDPSVRGRLLTIDSFSLSPEPTTSTGASLPIGDSLDATLNITSFVTPADQGLTAGASPTGPAPTATSTVASTTTEPVAP